MLFDKEYGQYLRLANLLGENSLQGELRRLTQQEEGLLEEPLQLIAKEPEFDQQQKDILDDVYEKYNQDQLYQLVDQLVGERKHLLQIIEALNSERLSLRLKNKELLSGFVHAQFPTHSSPLHPPHDFFL